MIGAGRFRSFWADPFAARAAIMLVHKPRSNAASVSVSVPQKRIGDTSIKFRAVEGSYRSGSFPIAEILPQAGRRTPGAIQVLVWMPLVMLVIGTSSAGTPTSIIFPQNRDLPAVQFG